MRRRRLKQASFRGVFFQMESHEFETGRRTVKNEYPERDQPFIDDLGRKSREFTLSAFVSGRFVQEERDKLIDACEEKGSGLLIHPYYGTKEVSCTGCRVSESALETGIIYLELSFVESGEPPTIKLDLSFFQKLASHELIKTAADFLSNSYSSFSDSTDFLDDLTDSFDRASKPILTMNQNYTNFNDSFTHYKRNLKDLTRDPRSLVRQSVELYHNLVKTITTPFQTEKLISSVKISFSFKLVLKKKEQFKPAQQGIPSFRIRNIVYFDK